MMLPSVPLFWRVFADQRRGAGLAFIGLVLAPVRFRCRWREEIAVLIVGLLGLLAVNLLLLRPAFRPLDELAETMRRHDPLHSRGASAVQRATADVAALARAFNEMLDRLEDERRDSARRALMLQESRAPPGRA